MKLNKTGKKIKKIKVICEKWKECRHINCLHSKQHTEGSLCCALFCLMGLDGKCRYLLASEKHIPKAKSKVVTKISQNTQLSLALGN